MDFISLTDVLANWIISVGQTVNDLPGVTAFALGLFTWFAAEQILRRVVAGLRWIILVAALAALGVSVPYIASLLTDPPSTQQPSS